MVKAFLLTWTVFAFWGVLGLSVFALFPARVRALQKALLSPVMGLAISAIFTVFLSRAGFPVKSFGTAVCVLLLLVAIVILLNKRPIFPAKRLIPFGGVLLFGMVLAARPMFEYGFDWLSFGNSDMGTYALGAKRFLNNGFYDVPAIQQILEGKDYSLGYWFFHVIDKNRPGNELLLALLWAVSGLNAHQVFMPLIFSMYMALMTAAAALVAGRTSRIKAPLAVIFLMAVSPMTTLGVLYQLIGQISGLALLCGSVALTYRVYRYEEKRQLLLMAVPAVIVLVALFFCYPEVLPFYVVGAVAYILLQVFRGRSWVKVGMPALIVVGVLVIVLNTTIIDTLQFVMAQSRHGLKVAQDSGFLLPYFLLPTGLAFFWGLLPLGVGVGEPATSVFVLVGGGLLVWLAFRLLFVQLREGIAAPIVVAVMMAVGGVLFFRENDFGVFKVAMYIQPFVLSVFVLGLLKRKNGWLVKGGLCGMVVCMLLSQAAYVEQSRGETYEGMSEVYRSSVDRINSEFKGVVDKLASSSGGNAVLLVDDGNIITGKMKALYAGELPIFFPAGRYNSVGPNSRGLPDSVVRLFDSSDQYDSGEVKGNKFYYIKDDLLRGKEIYYYRNPYRSDVFNIRTQGVGKNYLQFVDSELGKHYSYSWGKRGDTAFYRVERDPLFSGQLMSALGRKMLFQVINLSERPRLVIEQSSTVVKQFDSSLPEMNVGGDTLGFVGRGSARVFSQPITPENFAGKQYLQVEVMRETRGFPEEKRGVMLLYGRDVPQDNRKITTFCREISLVSESDYQGLKPPVILKRFPDDLANKDLEYSGIYEDGWVSEQSFYVLMAEPDSRFIVLKTTIPLIDNPAFSTRLTVMADGKIVWRENVAIGQLDLKIPVSVSGGRHRIALMFDGLQRLPGADGRPVGAQIQEVGFGRE